MPHLRFCSLLALGLFTTAAQANGYGGYPQGYYPETSAQQFRQFSGANQGYGYANANPQAAGNAEARGFAEAQGGTSRQGQLDGDANFDLQFRGKARSQGEGSLQQSRRAHATMQQSRQFNGYGAGNASADARSGIYRQNQGNAYANPQFNPGFAQSPYPAPARAPAYFYPPAMPAAPRN